MSIIVEMAAAFVLFCLIMAAFFGAVFALGFFGLLVEKASERPSLLIAVAVIIMAICAYCVNCI